MKINLNDKVRVRLTDDGKRMHRSKHEHLAAEIKRRNGPDFPYTPVEEKDGWSEWQLWQLMQEFGPMLFNGTTHLPFDTEIEIVLKQ